MQYRYRGPAACDPAENCRSTEEQLLSSQIRAAAAVTKGRGHLSFRIAKCAYLLL